MATAPIHSNSVQDFLIVRDLCNIGGQKGLLNVSRSGLYKAIQENRFPRPIKLIGGRKVGWPRQIIDDLVVQWERNASLSKRG